MAEYGIDRIVSSPHARCLESVAPLARRRGIEIECREELAPEATRNETLELLAELPERALVCTHREVFERVFGGEITCEKGGIWLVERKGRRRVPVAYLPPPSTGVTPRERKRHTATPSRAR